MNTDIWLDKNYAGVRVRIKLTAGVSHLLQNKFALGCKTRNTRVKSMLQKVELFSTTTFRNLQQPDLMQEWIESGWKNEQHRFLTRFAVMLQKKLNVFVVRFKVPLRIWAWVGGITTVSTRREGGTWKSANFFRTCLSSCALYVSSRKAGALRDETSRARTRQPKSLSRPQSPSFLGHVVGYENAEWGTRMRKSRINFPALSSPHNKC